MRLKFLSKRYDKVSYLIVIFPFKGADALNSGYGGGKKFRRSRISRIKDEVK